MTDWFVKFLLRVVARIETWEERTETAPLAQLSRIKTGKTTVDDLFRSKGLTLKQCGGRTSGGTADGNSGRRFFSQNNVPNIAKLTERHSAQEDIMTLHLNLSAMLRVVSSSEIINMSRYTDLAKETSMILTRKFPWARINHMLLPLIHHSADLIFLNNGISLGSLSEEALESNNKFIRRFNQTHSRQNSPLNQLR